MMSAWNTLFKLAGLLFVLSALSCVSDSSSNRPRAEVLFEDERDKDFRNQDSFSRSCRSGQEESDKVALRRVDYIDSNNAGAYTLRGRCDERDKTVRITVNGYKISNNPVCDNKRWEVELDLSAVVITEKSVVFHISHDDDRICKEVRVAFTGPPGYIPVPPLEDYYEFGFFVMKYEAKVDSRNSSTKAVSKPDGAPLTRMTYEDAVTLCRNNGPRYDLINNSQWQNIVRSIEDTDENWSSGKNIISDSNTLNCGVMRGHPQPAQSDDRKDCSDYNCNSYWDVKRRTHILSNGERIWDICGNVGEIMKDKYKAGESFRGDVYELTGQLKKLFGPKRSYDLVKASRRTNKWNLGYADIKENSNLIVRGAQGSFSGIFSTLVKRDQADRRGDTYVGFRCVYLP